jgi:hypothetical protein
MTTASTFEINGNPTLGERVLRLRRTSPPLFWVGLAMLAMSLLTLALMLVDARQFQGVSVWSKPWKFQVSTGSYLLTLALFMVWLPRSALHTRTARYVVWVAVASGIFEVGYIAWQGALGQGSHFNTASRFHAWMYSLMGVGAVLLASAALALGILIARSKDYKLPPALKLAIVLGLIATFVLGTGFGGYLSAQRAGHWVGGTLTDAGGLPVFNWSRSGGDLRVAHFFGIHAMHFIPAFGAVLAVTGAGQAAARRAVWVFVAVFTVQCIWTFVQATRGQPFLG